MNIRPAKLPPGILERVLLGTAVGDSLGLPAEGLSPHTIAQRWHGNWRHRLFLGRGMVSDDTEHTVFVAKCLLWHNQDVKDFGAALGWCLRGWLASMPPGVGWATARATLKLWLGVPSQRSGVFSAGNGPAMRSAIIGVYFADDPEKLRAFVHASTRITHTDPRAETAACAVACTAALASRHPRNQPLAIETLVGVWRSVAVHDAEWLDCISRLEKSGQANQPVCELVQGMGLQHGITGYAYHTVPVALYSFYRNDGDFQKTLEDVLNCGGDTDSTAAICGALAALRADIPPSWINGITDWPISTSYLKWLAKALESGSAEPDFWRWALLPIRNLFVFGLILVHALRRLFP